MEMAPQEVTMDEIPLQTAENQSAKPGNPTPTEFFTSTKGGKPIHQPEFNKSQTKTGVMQPLTNKVLQMVRVSSPGSCWYQRFQEPAMVPDATKNVPAMMASGLSMKEILAYLGE